MIRSMPDLQEKKTKLKERHNLKGCDALNKAVEKKPRDATTPSKKARKRSSPFRIKVGCVVALRTKPEGNQLTKTSPENNHLTIFPDESMIPVWTSPLKDRDEGLALVGKRVRCFLPKHLVEGKKRRVLEGEVVGIEDYLKRSDGKPWKVDLLVDKSMLSEFPFLVRTDEDLDLSQLATEKSRRNARLEEVLKGTNKCSVRVRLSQPGNADAKNALKWVVQKTVPKRLFQSIPSSAGVNGAKGKTENDSNKDDLMNEKSESSNRSKIESEPPKKKRKIDQNAVKYLGDKDDSPDQQSANWRWIVGRYHDMLLNSDDLRWKIAESQLFSLGFVGEVVKVESLPKGSASLASVSVRRMLLPEHTVPCVFPSAERAEIFDDFDSEGKLFQIPVEELVVLSRSVLRLDSIDDVTKVDDDDEFCTNVPKFLCRMSYSTKRNEYMTTNERGEWMKEDMSICHRCRQPILDTESFFECCGGSCQVYDTDDVSCFCAECIHTLNQYALDAMSSCDSPPCYMGLCDCLMCRTRRSSEVASAIIPTKGKIKDGSLETIFDSAVQNVSSQNPVAFGLPDIMFCWSSTPAPSAKPVVRPKTFGMEKGKGRYANGKRKPGKSSEKTGKDRMTNDVSESAVEEEDMSVFKPTCARLLAYDDIRLAKKKGLQPAYVLKKDRPRNLREHRIEVAAAVEGDGKTDRRAERAKQRRLLKGIAAFDSLDMDTLSSREPQLRFDRSGIHAWGVFADKDISSGDMIVEYRGEIIENAMAEKRERLYEEAKIGSDYMFRIDGRFVCDATKVGNVARFINASCDPNCYTKIINVDGEKRIVIYAKRDIAAGEELCYDYKFPHEYDPAKRIPCRCGASNCRGFMNWDKRYVVVGHPESQITSSGKASRSTFMDGSAPDEGEEKKASETD